MNKKAFKNSIFTVHFQNILKYPKYPATKIHAIKELFVQRVTAKGAVCKQMNKKPHRVDASLTAKKGRIARL